MASNLDWDWSFPAGGVCVLDVQGGDVVAKVVCDLGFGTYKTLKAVLSGFTVNDNEDHVKIATQFIQEWSLARQEQGLLVARTSREIGCNDWLVHLYQKDNLATIGQALEEQGLAAVTVIH